jgi:UPF0716 family protein affecting phage T7 exclusion
MIDSKVAFVMGAIYLSPHIGEPVAIALSVLFFVVGTMMLCLELRGDK